MNSEFIEQNFYDIISNYLEINEINKKNLIDYILNNEDHSFEFEDYTYDYIKNNLSKEKWFNEYTINSILNNNFSEEIINFFIGHISTTNIDLFIKLFEKTKSFLFFQNNFFRYNYTEEQIQKIKDIFNINNFFPVNTTYALKRDIYDIFGLIPLLMSSQYFAFYDIESENSFKEYKELDQELRFLINNFKFLNDNEKIDVIIFSFYQHFYENNIYEKDFKNFLYFYKKNKYECDKSFDFLRNKKNKSAIEKSFINDILIINII